MFEIFRSDGTGGSPELMHNHVISVSYLVLLTEFLPATPSVWHGNKDGHMALSKTNGYL